MEIVSFKELAGWSGGRLVKGNMCESIGSLSTDSRSLKAGDLFLAIKGEKFDGHDFLTQLPGKKVNGAIVSRVNADTAGLKNVLLVPDTVEALKKIAAGYLRKMSGLKVAGLTGSNGKTTTKDMLGSILSSGIKTHVPKGSFNNAIGLPLTILETDASYGVLVLEYGTNHPGEIADLVSVAKPDSAGITNIGTAHIGFFKTKENILKEKATLLKNLKKGGTAAVNLDDEYTASLLGSLKNRILTYSTKKNADLKAEDIKVINEKCGGTVFKMVYGGKSVDVKMNVLGPHNVNNALCAAAVAAGLGLKLEALAAGLNSFKPLSVHRLAIEEIKGIKLIDDAYNANPDSIKGAITTLKGLTAKRRLLVLGEMAELGEFSQEFHEGTGKEAAIAGFDQFLAVGSTAEWYKAGAKMAGMQKKKIRVFSTNNEAAEYLKNTLKKGDAVLIKGSRKAKMEEIVNIIKKGE